MAAVTLTKIVGPYNMAPNIKVAIYQAVFTTYDTSGCAADISGDFDYIYSLAIGGCDAVADNGYKFDTVIPSSTTAVTSTNCLITAFWDKTPAGASVFGQVTNSEDLSAVGQLSLVAIGS